MVYLKSLVEISLMFFLVFILFLSGCVQKNGEEKVIVTRIIDGDTLEVLTERMGCADANNCPEGTYCEVDCLNLERIKEKVRVLGIDYPDITSDRIDKWIGFGLNETKIKNCYRSGIGGVKILLENKSVILSSDSLEQDKDKYGRYVNVDGTDLGEYLLVNGYAVMYDPIQPLCSKCSFYQTLEKKGGCLWN